jgi:hypothetical protein
MHRWNANIKEDLKKKERKVVGCILRIGTIRRFL